MLRTAPARPSENPSPNGPATPRARGLNRVSFLRHLAISIAALTAYLLRVELKVGNGVLWVLGASAAVNLLLYLVSEHPAAGRISRLLSPVLGLAGWAALVGLTGGVRSPFVAGFAIEIVFAAMSSGAGGTAWVTAGAVAGLWAQQWAQGWKGSATSLSLQSAFLVATGIVTAVLVRRWARAHMDLSRDYAGLQDRLLGLERELDDLREVGRVGENVALLAHGLKNAVHSLRGFAALIEPRLGDHESSREALAGLRAAIDRMEEIGRLTLHPPAVSDGHADRCAGPVALRAVEDVMSEVSAAHPGIRWVKRFGEHPPVLPVSLSALQEVVRNLLRNAAEAMDGAGEITLETGLRAGCFVLHVRDRGCGVHAEDLEEMFRPGYTTKDGGSGFGLYLARRVVETHGGRLTAAQAPGGGASFAITLPAAEP